MSYSKIDVLKLRSNDFLGFLAVMITTKIVTRPGGGLTQFSIAGVEYNPP